MKRIFILLIFASLRGMAQPPVSIVLLHDRMGKPPLEFYTVDMVIRNDHDSLCWFVFPYFANDSITGNGKFEEDVPPNLMKRPVSVENTGQIVEVEAYSPGNFRAFCLPPHAMIHLYNYGFNTWKPIDSIEYWMVKRMIVNGRVPLEKWYPVDITSSKNADVICTEWINHDWDRVHDRKRKDDRKQPIKLVEAMGIKKFHAEFFQPHEHAADSLLWLLNFAAACNGDTLHPVKKERNYSAQNDFGEYHRELDNLSVPVKWEEGKYVLVPYSPQKLVDQLNEYASAGGDHEHPVEGVVDLGEAGALFQKTKETLSAYGILISWDAVNRKYILK